MRKYNNASPNDMYEIKQNDNVTLYVILLLFIFFVFNKFDIRSTISKIQNIDCKTITMS